MTGRATTRRSWPFLLRGLLAAGLLASPATLVATPLPDPCDLSGLVQDLRYLGLPAVAAVSQGPGQGAGVILCSGEGPALLLGAGIRAPDGALVTRSRLLEGEAPVRSLWMTLQDQAVDGLGVSPFRGCPALALQEPPEGTLGAAVDLLARDLSHRPAADGEKAPLGVVTSRLQAAVVSLVLAVVIAYLVLCLWRVLPSARGLPRRDLAILLVLLALAVLVRGGMGPRLPVGTANSDLSHLLDIHLWDLWGFGVHQGVTYPPAWRLAIWMAFHLFGPSWDLAAWMTTVAGALLVLPVTAWVRRATGSWMAGALAGLAAAVMPVGVRFSNGVVLETPAGLLLAACCWHFWCWLEGRRALDGLLWALSLVLLVQTRLETLGILPMLLLVQGTVAAWRLGVAGLRRLWPWAAVGLALGLPFLVQVALLLLTREQVQGDKASGMLLPVLVFGGIGLSLAVALRPARQAPLAGEPWASFARVLAGALMLLFVVEAAVQWPGNPWMPEAITHPDYPFYRFYITWPHGTWPDDRVYPGWLVNAGTFPLPFLGLWLLSLWTWRGTSREVRGLSWLLALLPWFGHFLTRHVGTGIAPFEGLRHHVVFLGPVAASVGLGAWQVLRTLEHRPVARRAATLALVGVLASPVATHRGALWDQDFNPQREFRFARSAVDRLPDRSRVIVADDVVDFGPEARMPPSSILPVFRGNHLWLALAWVSGRVLDVRGAREDARLGDAPGGPAWFYQGLDCHRSPVPGRMLPSCEAAAAVAAADPDLAERIPNRPYTAQSASVIGIRKPELELALRPLDPEALRRFRRDVQP